MQSRGNGTRRGSKSQFPEANKTIKGEDIVLGSVLFLNKSTPSPRFRVNPFLHYDFSKTGRLYIPEDIANTVAKLDVMLKGKQSNENDEIEIIDSVDDID